MALELERRGILQVRPLEGGLAAWMARSFPVDPVPAPAIPALDRPGASGVPPAGA